MDTKWMTQLVAIGACHELVKWARTQETPKALWQNCGRGDWLLWLLGMTGADRKLLVRAACDCAETAVEYVEDGAAQMAILFALHVTLEWTEGRADLDDVREARGVALRAAANAYAADNAAYAAANAAYAAYAATDANAATDVNAAANAAANAAYAATSAAANATYAAVAAAAAAARERALARCAEIVRSYFPAPPVLP